MAGYAVDCFVILSGFVITLLLFKTQESYRPFLIRRWFRLFPLYAVCMLVGGLLYSLQINNLLLSVDWLTPARFQGQMEILRTIHANPIPYLIACLFMLQGAIPQILLPDAPIAFLGPAWSISLEWQFYLLAPFAVPAMLVVPKSAKSFSVWALIVVAFLAAWFGIIPRVALGAFLPFHIEFFALGIASYGLYRLVPEETELRLPILPAGLLLTLFLLPIAKGNPALFPWLIWLVALSLILQHKVGGFSTMRSALDLVIASPPMLFLGKISYGIYLAHLPMIICCQALLFTYLPDLGQRHHLWLLTPLVVLSTILTSTILHYVIERPGMNYARRLLKR